MKLHKYIGYFFLGTAAFVCLALQVGCGEDKSLYQGETLAFENTLTLSDSQDETHDLDLGADESSNFWLNYYYPWAVPFAAPAFYEYYLEPLPIEVPISPVASIVDFVHPFYAYRHISPFFGRRHFDRDDD